ncbi:MAG: radical SAM protein, partial [Candidatus Thorarchaeota archaeon]
EARSLILQATVGCSHNACTFCISYKDRKYKVRGAAEIEKDLAGLPTRLKNETRKVFLADGNALAMTTDAMVGVLHVLKSELPSLQRVGTYGYAKDVRDKSIEDLQRIREEGLGIVYFGLETGDDDLLRWARKGVDSEENVIACQKIRGAGIPLSITVILGLGGYENSESHAKATARVLNEIDPEYVGALTLMTPAGTRIHDLVKQNEFIPMQPFDVLKELHTLIDNLELTNCIFRTNHASNYLPIGGTLSREKKQVLSILRNAIETGDERDLRPSYLRGL